ncbi:ALQxL family class IV lanthipeptide [Streptosporangium sp. NPDC002544]
MELDINALDLLPGRTEQHLAGCTITCDVTCKQSTCGVTSATRFLS